MSINEIVDIIDNIDTYKKKTVEWWNSIKDMYIWKNKENVTKYAYLGDDA